MKLILDGIFVKAIETIKNSFEVNDEYSGPDTVQVYPRFELGLEQNTDNTNQYRLTMKVSIGTVGEDAFPYRVETIIRSVVELEDIPTDKHHDVLRTNCAAIMFPYARANISTIMSCSGVAPYILPVMNMEKLFGREESQISVPTS